MKIKKRFKKALFAFFKDEILNSVGAQKTTEKVNYVSKELQLIEIDSEIIIDETRQIGRGIAMNSIYEEALNRCKRKLFEKAMKHIQIDELSVMGTDLHSNGIRTIRVSLFIGLKNQNHENNISSRTF